MFAKPRVKTHRWNHELRGLGLEPLEERRLLTVDSQFSYGLLTISSSADDEIVLSSRDGLAKVNDTDPTVGQIAAAEVTDILVRTAADTRVIDVSALDSTAYPSVKRLVLGGGPWINPVETLAVINESLGPGWAEKLGIKDPHEFLISGQWKDQLADGSLAKQLSSAVSVALAGSVMVASEM